METRKYSVVSKIQQIKTASYKDKNNTLLDVIFKNSYQKQQIRQFTVLYIL